MKPGYRRIRGTDPFCRDWQVCYSARTRTPADTRIGVTIYKYDDNFMSVVRRLLEVAKSRAGCSLLIIDSQNVNPQTE